jgi:hypothetical protein
MGQATFSGSRPPENVACPIFGQPENVACPIFGRSENVACPIFGRSYTHLVRVRRVSLALLLSLSFEPRLGDVVAAADPLSRPSSAPPTIPPTTPTEGRRGVEIPEPARPLADAPAEEQDAIRGLLGSDAWPRRIIAVLRLQRFDCPESATMLADSRHDRHPAVRSFVWLALGHRRIPAEPDWLTHEDDPRVIRTALRAGYGIDAERLSRGVAALSKSSALDDKLLAAELALLSDDDDLHDLATSLVQTVVLRMSDVEGGAFSPRLARITSGEDLRRAYKWRNWWKRNRRRPLDAARMLPAMTPASEIDRTIPTPSPEDEWSEVAMMDLADFSRLADHLERLAHQPVDLAIVIDCTASMSGEIAEAQGGIDDLMRFVGDVSGGIRVGIVGYRDRRERFETVGWDFTTSISDARRNLWRLSAEGGGDKPELVDQGLELAVTTFHWDRAHRGVLVLVGDAPPHPGRGAACVALAQHAHRHGVTTHVIGCDPAIVDDDDPAAEIETVTSEPEKIDPREIRRAGRSSHRVPASIDFFPEIAAAGGGRVVNLARDQRLVPEIAGLVVGTEFEAPLVEFFEIYMALK